MTGEKDMFTSFQPSHDQSGNIVFGNNGKGEVLGLGKIAISNDNSISNVLLVNSLRYNLLRKIGFVAHAKRKNKLELNIPSRML